MTNDELLVELGSMISNLSQRIHERDAVIAQLRDIIAEYEGVATPKKLYDTNYVGSAKKKLSTGAYIARRKNCPHCGVEHTVRLDGGMYKHWVRKNGQNKLCPGIWTT